MKRTTIKGIATEDIKAGDAVELNPENGRVRRSGYESGWNDPRKMSPDELMEDYVRAKIEPTA